MKAPVSAVPELDLARTDAVLVRGGQELTVGRIGKVLCGVSVAVQAEAFDGTQQDILPAHLLLAGGQVDDAQAQHLLPRGDLDRPIDALDVRAIDPEVVPAGRKEELELAARPVGEEGARGPVVIAKHHVGRPPPIIAQRDVGFRLPLEGGRALHPEPDPAAGMHDDRHRLADLRAGDLVHADEGAVETRFLADRVDAFPIEMAFDLELQNGFAAHVGRRFLD